MEISNPTLGSVKQVSSMLKMSASPFKVRNWARSFGEHTDEILRELGYSKARIKALRKSAIIG
jgi:crotonobetainyl-CoA:carnitine CoA-transferase CaiB-like acyl-CoA transferase